jgi:hypothetical protein
MLDTFVKDEKISPNASSRKRTNYSMKKTGNFNTFEEQEDYPTKNFMAESGSELNGGSINQVRIAKNFIYTNPDTERSH